MLILILIKVQYLQKVVFSFEKGLNGQNHSPSGSHILIKNTPPAKFLIPPPPPPPPPETFKILGWCPAGSVLPHGEKVSL